MFNAHQFEFCNCLQIKHDLTWNYGGPLTAVLCVLSLMKHGMEIVARKQPHYYKTFLFLFHRTENKRWPESPIMQDLVIQSNTAQSFCFQFQSFYFLMNLPSGDHV